MSDGRTPPVDYGGRSAPRPRRDPADAGAARFVVRLPGAEEGLGLPEVAGLPSRSSRTRSPEQQDHYQGPRRLPGTSARAGPGPSYGFGSGPRAACKPKRLPRRHARRAQDGTRRGLDPELYRTALRLPWPARRGGALTLGRQRPAPGRCTSRPLRGLAGVCQPVGWSRNATGALPPSSRNTGGGRGEVWHQWLFGAVAGGVEQRWVGALAGALRPRSVWLWLLGDACSPGRTGSRWVVLVPPAG
ncbi:hypothetical protein ACRAWF_39635 [Streptomyces sp. L7]